MFTAIVRAEVISQALTPVDALVNECKLRLSPDGVSVTAVDPANVAMVDMEVSADAFESFQASDGVIGVNLVRLLDVIGMADSDDLVEFHLNGETNKLEIEIAGLEYTLALIDADSIRSEPDLPDLDLPGTFVFEASEFDRAITAADLCSDHISIKANGDLRFVAEGDTDDVEVTLGDDELLSSAFSWDDETESLFSLDYLEDILAPLKDEELSLLVGDEMPLKMRYSTGESGEKDVFVTNMVAPRIQNS